jgi:hypothetical protein
MVYDDRDLIESTPQKNYAKMRNIRLYVLPIVIASFGEAGK